MATKLKAAGNVATTVVFKSFKKVLILVLAFAILASLAVSFIVSLAYNALV